MPEIRLADEAHRTHLRLISLPAHKWNTGVFSSPVCHLTPTWHRQYLLATYSSVFHCCVCPASSSPLLATDCPCGLQQVTQATSCPPVTATPPPAWEHQLLHPPSNFSQPLHHHSGHSLCLPCSPLQPQASVLPYIPATQLTLVSVCDTCWEEIGLNSLLSNKSCYLVSEFECWIWVLLWCFTRVES